MRSDTERSPGRDVGQRRIADVAVPAVSNWLAISTVCLDGTHRLDASTVIDGETVELSEEFSIEPVQQRYAGLNYWHYVPTSPNDPSSDPPGFSFVIQDEPIGFA
jgi:hypothetical protein